MNYGVSFIELSFVPPIPFLFIESKPKGIFTGVPSTGMDFTLIK